MSVLGLEKVGFDFHCPCFVCATRLLQTQKLLLIQTDFLQIPADCDE